VRNALPESFTQLTLELLRGSCRAVITFNLMVAGNILNIAGVGSAPKYFGVP
jgi:hypothetical protein